MARSGTPQAEPRPLTREEVERAALAYLNRFDSSVANLRRVLFGFVKRTAEQRGAAAVENGATLVEEVIARYQESGLVDDQRFAGNVAAGLRRKGSSGRAILHKLRARGVAEDVAKSALGDVDTDVVTDAELEAARALVRRRRLGPFRAEADRAPNRRRDLGALARAGFSFDVARRALGTTADDEDEW